MKISELFSELAELLNYYYQNENNKYYSFVTKYQKKNDDEDDAVVYSIYKNTNYINNGITYQRPEVLFQTKIGIDATESILSPEIIKTILGLGIYEFPCINNIINLIDNIKDEDNFYEKLKELFLNLTSGDVVRAKNYMVRMIM